MNDQAAFLADRLVTTIRPEVEQKAADLTSKFPGLKAGEMRLRLWVVETTLVLLAGESSTAETARLERFFDAFWSEVSTQLLSDFPDHDVREEFDAGMDRLTAEIAADRETLPHEEASAAMGKRIAAFLGVPEGEPLGYGYKLATASKLLEHLPE
jgi:hypothetical protein